MEPEENFYTPAELVERYPDAKKIGWSATKIGIFFRAGLLLGYYSSSERKAMISEASFVRLVTLRNENVMGRLLRV